jgi:hypothetical protein
MRVNSSLIKSESVLLNFSQEEFHPLDLTERCVTVCRHPVPVRVRKSMVICFGYLKESRIVEYCDK